MKMNSRERVKAIINREPADRCGLWLGNPEGGAWAGLLDHAGVVDEEAWRLKLQDDFRWISPQFAEDAYRHPEGHGFFNAGFHKTSHGQAGPLADCDNVADVDRYPWPSLDYLNFDSTIKRLQDAGDYYRASGFWTCFYHDVMDLFGIEDYLVKMYTEPDVVHAVTNHVCEFYYEANERFFAAAGDLVDGFFFGNDFGTQLDLICGPDQFDEFIMPWFRKFTDQAHKHGYQAILHSCGAISKVIDRLIDAGVDCLHPLQAKAEHMSAEEIGERFGGRITFMGGIDTQDLLVHATPEQIKDDVRRIKDALGPNLIVSPSHEAILPNVPPANIEAMAEAAVM